MALEANVEEVRRKAGDRGGVTPPIPWREFKDVRLCSVGVIDRSFRPMELELGVLRRGLFRGWPKVDGEGESFLLGSSV